MILFLAENNASPDVICLQETWQIVNQDMFSIKGYHDPLFKLRSVNTQGGGVGIYVKSNISINLLPNYSVFTDKVIETIFVKITTSNKKNIFVGSICRSNSKYTSLTENQQFVQFNNTLANILAKLSDPKQEVYIFRDFNIDLLKYLSNNFAFDYVESIFRMDSYKLSPNQQDVLGVQPH
jgi:exonuclease III